MKPPAPKKFSLDLGILNINNVNIDVTLKTV